MLRVYTYYTEREGEEENAFIEAEREYFHMSEVLEEHM